MGSELTLSQEASQYKSIIREQDNKIQTLSEQLRQFQMTNGNLMVNITYIMRSITTCILVKEISNILTQTATTPRL